MKLIDPTHPMLNKPLEDSTYTNILEMQTLAEQMYDFVSKSGGAGLSANQVGIEERVFVINYKDYKQTFINPRVTWLSDEYTMLEEGCLSYPGVFINVKRPTGCRISYTDYHGEYHEEALFTGLSNRIILHEYDHMEGKFFYDHLSNLQKGRFWKKVKKKM